MWVIKNEKENDWNQEKPAHNKRYTLRRLIGGSGFRSPRSLRSHGSLHPHFANPGLCYAKPLFGFAKRRIPRTLGEIWAKVVDKN